MTQSETTSKRNTKIKQWQRYSTNRRRQMTGPITWALRENGLRRTRQMIMHWVSWCRLMNKNYWKNKKRWLPNKENRLLLSRKMIPRIWDYHLASSRKVNPHNSISIHNNSKTWSTTWTGTKSTATSNIDTWKITQPPTTPPTISLVCSPLKKWQKSRIQTNRPKTLSNTKF